MDGNTLLYMGLGAAGIFVIEYGFLRIDSSQRISERTKAIITGIGICIGLAGVGALMYDVMEKRSEIKTMNKLESTVNNPTQVSHQQR